MNDQFACLNFYFQHPLGQMEELSSGNRDSRDKRLLLWYYEAQLKEKYGSFVKALEVSSEGKTCQLFEGIRCEVMTYNKTHTIDVKQIQARYILMNYYNLDMQKNMFTTCENQ